VAMLAKNFESFMKNNKFKKKLFDKLRKAPHTIDTEEAEKKKKIRGVPSASNVHALGSSGLNVQI
jgi:hypothetical protein